MVKPILSDGSCQAGYHIDNGNCAINSVHKLPNGNCPVGAIMTTTNICVTTPVLPGTSTGSGGGFIQMFPMKPATPPATPPNQDTPPLQPQAKQFAQFAGGAQTLGLPSAPHVFDGVLSINDNPDRSCPAGTTHVQGNSRQCAIDTKSENPDGSCPSGTSHFQGADPKQCFVDTAIQTSSTNTGGSTGTTTTTTTPATTTGGRKCY